MFLILIFIGDGVRDPPLVPYCYLNRTIISVTQNCTGKERRVLELTNTSTDINNMLVFDPFKSTKIAFPCFCSWSLLCHCFTWWSRADDHRGGRLFSAYQCPPCYDVVMTRCHRRVPVEAIRCLRSVRHRKVSYTHAPSSL